MSDAHNSFSDEDYENGSTDSAENSAFSQAPPPDLAVVLSVWRHLPEHIRRAIVTLVEGV